MSRCALAATVALTACLLSACATTRAVPRPFPGAADPPGTVKTPPATPEAPRGSGSTTPAPAPSPVPPVAGRAPASPLLATALALAGTPYRNGGSTPAGFDCSGFVQYVFSRHGQALPRDVQAQFKVGERIDRDDIRPGDLVFFETVSRGASHVGIAMGNGEFVHAPSSRGVVRVERYTSDYWAKRWVGARRMAGGKAATAGTSQSPRS